MFLVNSKRSNRAVVMKIVRKEEMVNTSLAGKPMVDQVKAEIKAMKEANDAGLPVAVLDRVFHDSLNVYIVMAHPNPQPSASTTRRQSQRQGVVPNQPPGTTSFTPFRE